MKLRLELIELWLLLKIVRFAHLYSFIPVQSLRKPVLFLLEHEHLLGTVQDREGKRYVLRKVTRTRSK